MLHERFFEAAQRVLKGEDSARAARDLEAVVLDDYVDDERFDELIYTLSIYAPAQQEPFSNADDLRRVIAYTLGRLD
jgi:hypothetical protein